MFKKHKMQILAFTINSNNVPFCSNREERNCYNIDFWNYISDMIELKEVDIVLFLGQDNNDMDMFSNYLVNEMENINYRLVSGIYTHIDVEGDIIRSLSNLCIGTSCKETKLSNYIFIKDNYNRNDTVIDTINFMDKNNNEALVTIYQLHDGSTMGIFNIDLNEKITNKVAIFDDIMSEILLGRYFDYIICAGSFNFIGKNSIFLNKSKYSRFFEEGVNNEGITFKPTCFLSPKRNENLELEETLLISKSRNHNGKKFEKYITIPHSK